MRALIATGHAAIIAALLFAWGGIVQPAVSADSNKTCVLDGASVMAFGVYDPMNETPLDVQGRVSYRCGHDNRQGTVSRLQSKTPADSRKPLIVQITLSTGNAGRFDRYMNGGRDQLRYNLYLDPQRTQVWGDGTGGSQIYSAKAEPNNKVVIVPVFGRVFAGQDVAANFYVDTLIVTLDF